ncbi:DUF3397 domain-containing protein [Virgibacillus sp. MG-45]|uniref:DUF3397 domain-containing protein n=1 Tax=Virgibacillus sp. MG-45 TaxID=3102791 RepID=UPI002EDA973F
MIDMMAYFIAIFVTVPPITTFLIYRLLRLKSNYSRKAFFKAVNWTTLLYIIAVFIILNNLFDQFFIGIFLLVLLILFTVIIIVQWKTKIEINYQAAFKVLWRSCFLLFSFLYFVLICYGILGKIFV